MTQHFEFGVFLSHCAADQVAARQLAERLRGDELHVRS